MDNSYESLSDFVKHFYIPSYVLSPDSDAPALTIAPPESPVLVFVNSKSGGQLGGELLLTYKSLLNEKQVFDLGVETPDKVLRRIYLNLERLKEDDLARHIRDKLKIIVRRSCFCNVYKLSLFHHLLLIACIDIFIGGRR